MSLGLLSSFQMVDLEVSLFQYASKHVSYFQLSLDRLSMACVLATRMTKSAVPPPLTTPKNDRIAHVYTNKYSHNNCKQNNESTVNLYFIHTWITGAMFIAYLLAPAPVIYGKDCMTNDQHCHTIEVPCWRTSSVL